MGVCTCLTLWWDGTSFGNCAIGLRHFRRCGYPVFEFVALSFAFDCHLSHCSLWETANKRMNWNPVPLSRWKLVSLSPTPVTELYGSDAVVEVSTKIASRFECFIKRAFGMEKVFLSTGSVYQTRVVQILETRKVHRDGEFVEEFRRAMTSLG